MNWYAEAMRCIEEADTEKLAAVAKIMARKHPASFSRACGFVPRVCPGQKECTVQTNKISAIKICRVYTGKGLKEAKDAVEGECSAFKSKVW